METSTKDSGRMDKLMVKVSSVMSREDFTKELGPMINNKAKVLKHGIMELLDMKVTSSRDRRQAKVDLNSRAALTKETSLMVNSMEMASTTSLNQEKFIMANLLIIS
jgi:hypothetical protein